MTASPRIIIVTEERDDAIGIFSLNLIKRLEEQISTIIPVPIKTTLLGQTILTPLVELTSALKLLFIVKPDDIVLFTDPLSPSFLYSIFIKRNKKYATFFHIDRMPHYYKLIPNLSFRSLINNLDGIICSSQFSTKQLKALGISSNKLQIVQCGIDHQIFKPSTSKLFPFEYILSIGSEEPRKNMKNTLKAFKILKQKFPELKLLKVGTANNANRTRTMRYVNELQLAKDVIFLNHCPTDDLPAIYSGARLLLFPSLREGFGLPIIEAMACGCPVITSNRQPMMELIGPDSIVVNPLDPSDIANACDRLISNNHLRKALIHKGLIQSKRFNWKLTAKYIHQYITSE